jgi:hypothetical protein
MKNSTDTNSPLPDSNSYEPGNLGQYLKKLRESKSISIEAISYKTRINLTVAKILENNEIKQLPDKTYVRGYVKSYCRELGGNLAEALAVLDSCYSTSSDVMRVNQESLSHTPLKNLVTESSALKTNEKQKDEDQSLRPTTNISKNHKHKKTNSPVVKNNDSDKPLKKISSDSSKVLSSLQQIPNSQKNILTGALAVVVIVAVFFSLPTDKNPNLNEETKSVVENNLENSLPIENQETNEVTNDPKNPVDQEALATELNKVNSSIASPTPTNDNVPNVSNEKVASEITKVESKIVPTKEENMFDDGSPSGSETTVLPGDVKNIELEKEYSFTPISLPNYALIPDAKEVSNSDLLPENIKSSIVPGSQNLFLNAHSGDSWISYKIDDGPIKAFTLRKGRTLLIRGKEVRLFLGNTGTIKVFLNNSYVSFQPSNGVKSLVFPETAAKKYVTPLFIKDKSGRSFTSSEYLNLKADQIRKNLNETNL